MPHHDNLPRPGTACADLGAARREWRHQGENLLALVRMRLIEEADAEQLIERWGAIGGLRCGDALFDGIDELRRCLRAALIRCARGITG